MGTSGDCIRTCGYCEEGIQPHDRTINSGHHEECAVRMLIGSAAHQLGRCPCYGGDEYDPPEMSRRDAARLALETFRLLRRTESKLGSPYQ